MRISSFFLLFFVTACAATPRIAGAPDPHQIAAQNTCAQIAYYTGQIDQVIADNTPSDGEKLVKNTAVSAAKTGVNQSGVLGGGGAYAGIGMNFLSGLYNIDSKQRAQDAVRDAELQRDLLIEASYIKECL